MQNSEVPGSSLLDMTQDGAVIYDFEQRADSIVDEGDLPRIQKELRHNAKKQDRARRNEERGLRPDGRPLVREPDNN